MEIPIDRSDFKFQLFLKDGYAELTTSSRFINCEFWQLTDDKVTPKKYKLFMPYFWNLSPVEQAHSLDCILMELCKEGFTITAIRSAKPEELEIKMVR